MSQQRSFPWVLLIAVPLGIWFFGGKLVSQTGGESSLPGGVQLPTGIGPTGIDGGVPPIQQQQPQFQQPQFQNPTQYQQPQSRELPPVQFDSMQPVDYGAFPTNSHFPDAVRQDPPSDLQQDVNRDHYQNPMTSSECDQLAGEDINGDGQKDYVGADVIPAECYGTNQLQQPQQNRSFSW